MSVAERTREAVRETPFLEAALRAGVVNYSAAADYLGVGDTDAVAAALRRYADELPDYEPAAGDARVTMESGVGRAEPTSDALLVVGETALVAGEGSLTVLLAVGDVSPALLGQVVARCESAGVDVEAAAVADETLLVAVGRRDGPDALRIVEAAV